MFKFKFKLYIAVNVITLCVILYVTVRGLTNFRIVKQETSLENTVKSFIVTTTEQKVIVTSSPVVALNLHHGSDRNNYYKSNITNKSHLHEPSKRQRAVSSSAHLVVLRPTWLLVPTKREKQVTNCDVPCFITKDNSIKAIKRSDAVIFMLHWIEKIPFNKQISFDPDVILKDIGVDPTSVIKVGMSLESTRKHLQQFSQMSEYDIEFSFRQSSDVFYPYYPGRSYQILLKPVLKWSSRQSAIVFVANDCHSNSGREELVKLLQKYVQVDSVSGCLHNKEWPEDVPKSDKKGLLERYKVYLAAENSIETDYVTEKVYDGLEAGAVPVYFGAPNVEEFIPTNSSVIVPANFSESDIVKVVQTIKKIFNDEAEYNRWTSFKHHPYEEWFKKKFSFTNTDPLCWLCRRVIGLKEDYHWDRESHQIH